jgi:hypothetical protein
MFNKAMQRIIDKQCEEQSLDYERKDTFVTSGGTGINLCKVVDILVSQRLKLCLHLEKGRHYVTPKCESIENLQMN